MNNDVHCKNCSPEPCSCDRPEQLKPDRPNTIEEIRKAIWGKLTTHDTELNDILDAAEAGELDRIE